jgi:Luciferase-like monooxygenase
LARQPSYWMPTRSARIEVWGNDYRQILDTAAAAEELGFSAFYYGESPHSLNLETWTVLAGVTARTTSIRIGPVIANLASRLGVVPAFGATGARLDKALTGPAEVVAEKMGNYVHAGVDQFVAACVDPHDAIALDAAGMGAVRRVKLTAHLACTGNACSGRRPRHAQVS